MGASGCEGLLGADRIQPLESLADWSARAVAAEATAKIVNLADARARLRPSAPIAER
jgi:hypothetical protein